jgi:hypothetical protein
MVTNEITLGLKDGIIVDSKDELSKKEQKFIVSHNLELIATDLNQFVKDV